MLPLEQAQTLCSGQGQGTADWPPEPGGLDDQDTDLPG